MMLEFIKKLFTGENAPPPPRPGIVPYRRRMTKKPPTPQSARPTPATKLEPTVPGRIEDGGPGKNVLVRTKYQREDSGTHETLKIIDENLLEENNEDGIDPYNTGKFDRSKHWDKRFRD